MHLKRIRSYLEVHSVIDSQHKLIIGARVRHFIAVHQLARLDAFAVTLLILEVQASIDSQHELVVGAIVLYSN